MQGIERIKIIDKDSKSDYFTTCLHISEQAAPATSDIYRSILPLMDGEIQTAVDKEDIKGRYDYQEGIDVILTLLNGTRLTLQEKVLTRGFRTVTFEERKGYNNAEGAWYKCTAQLYFCCDVDQQYQIESYCLIDLLRLRICSVHGMLPWQYRQGMNEFRYLKYDEIPEECIIKKYKP
jgi:hypothetical protein